MDVATFRVRYPVFQNVAPQMVAAVIAEATLEVDPSVWRTMTETGIGLLAAHKLAIDPQGNNVRLVAKDGTTTYGNQYEELRGALVVGVVVSGGNRGLGRGWGWPF
jgi:hypothetical protein